jgi:hypothetical protein
VSDDVQCPHCGAVEDHVFDDISEADIGRPVTLVGPCWKCGQPYATEVRIEVYVRELTADELAAESEPVA